MSSNCYLSLSRNPDKRAYYQNAFRVTKRDFQALPDYITNEVWSPIVWEKGIRKKAHFQLTNLMAFDFDSGEWTLEDARDWCEGLATPYIIGTTKSHQIAKKSGDSVTVACDRFRVILLAKECTDVEDYEYTMRSIMDEIPCDISCKDGARFFFPCTKITYANFGKRLERVGWVKCPPEETRAAKMEAAIRAGKNADNSAVWPRWLKRAIESGASSGSRHVTLYRIGCYFGLSNKSDEWIAALIMKTPLAEIGEADVRRAITNGRERVQADYQEYRKEQGSRNEPGGSDPEEVGEDQGHEPSEAEAGGDCGPGLSQVDIDALTAADIERISKVTGDFVLAQPPARQTRRKVAPKKVGPGDGDSSKSSSAEPVRRAKRKPGRPKGGKTSQPGA